MCDNLYCAVTKQESYVKTCTSCGKVKSFDEFQKRYSSHDFLTASCRECLHERDRARYKKEREQRLAKHKEYMATEGGKIASARSSLKWKENNAVKRAAHVILGNAVRNGRVTKAPCFVCGSEKAVAHHPSYDLPLDVVWLCHDHHAQLHVAHRMKLNDSKD